ncbi:Pol polyprotein [Elysia marginata]|uniref:Pol polyprotein n=1 Tax=Elysia marginata TaxID=1093978 RepID=A0AAV4HNS1_9GAST|nr:Pol polyprotein [Elysia marginata]
MLGRALDFDTEVARVDANPEQYLGDVFRWGEIQLYGNSVTQRPSTANPNNCLNGGVGPDCYVPRDSTPPTVSSCPSDISVPTVYEKVEVTWTEPTFTEAVSVSSTYQPGTFFTQGDHKVVYLAKDSSGNVATCAFNVYVNDEFCPTLAQPRGGGQSVCFENVGNISLLDPGYSACSATCGAPGSASVERVPINYTCGPRGDWWSARLRASENLYPTCGRIEGPAANRVELNLKYTIDVTDCPSISAAIDTKAREDISNVIPESALSDGTNTYTAEDVFLAAVLDNAVLGFTDIFPSSVLDRDAFQVTVVPVCPIGQVVREDLCVSCGPGTSYNTTSSECDNCPVGQYQTGYSQLACLPCSPGLTTNGIGADDGNLCVDECLLGQFYSTVTSTCQSCPLGFYQDQTGQFQCKPCPVGETTGQVASTSIVSCAEGCNSGEQLLPTGVCSPCAVGTYRDAAVSRVCVPCPDGFTTFEEGSQLQSNCSILKCPAGSRADSTNTVCVLCPVGQYQPQINMKQCVPCPENFTTRSAGSVSFTECLRFCPSGEQLVENSCVKCDIASYKDNNQDPLGQCLPCPVGYITSSTGAETAAACDIRNCTAGYRTVIRQNGIKDCEACPLGFYQSAPYQDSCDVCPGQTSTRQTASADLSQCEAYCDSGFEIEAGTDNCQACEIGYYKDNLDDIFGLCVLCPGGSFITSAQAATSVGDCNIRNCSAGSFRNGLNQCEQCALGSYQPQKWQTSCLNCPEDTTTALPGATSIDQCFSSCPLGKELLFGTCVECRVGFYKDVVGSNSRCVKCPTGFITLSTGAQAQGSCFVVACDPGAYRNTVSNQCVQCPYGQFQPDQWQEACLSCPAGYTTFVQGATADSQCLLDCDAGSFLDVPTNSCLPCEEGFYRDKSTPTQTTCVQCPDGYTTLSASSDQASDCKNFRRSVFEAVYNLSHPGVKATIRLVSEKFIWHGLRRQVSTWVKECHECQSSKIKKHTRAPLETFTVPEKRFSHINIDIAGPLPESCGQRYLITIIDRNARWPEAIPIPNITSAECVQALVGGWISRFGIPQDILSHRGSQFTSALWTEIAKRLGVKVHRTTAFHPQANGMVERFHRTLKAALKARLTGNNWVEELPWVFLGLRTAPKEDLGYSSAELVYGEPLTVPGEFIPSQALPWSATDFLTAFRAKTQLLTPRPTVHHSKQHTYLPPSLLTAKYVYIRTDTVKTPLQRPYSGPYTVLAPGEKTFLVDIGGRAERISIDRLKPAQVDPTKPVQLQQPARRGHPPALPGPPSATETDDTRGQPAAQTDHRQLTSRTGRQVRLPMRFQLLSEMSVLGGGNCTAGYRTVTLQNGAKDCEVCPLGFYQSAPYQDSCDVCPGQTSTRQTASTDQSQCEAYCDSGYEIIAGTDNCQACEIGYYKDNLAGIFGSCVLCPDGEFITSAQAATSVGDCSIRNCSAGFFIDGQNRCKQCALGTYQPNKWQTSCLDCPVDTTTDRTGAISSDQCFSSCPLGKELIGGTCEECSVGFYKDVVGSDSSCVQCPTGFITAGTGAQSQRSCSIVACDPGTYRNTVSNQCVECPYGQFQPEQWQEACSSCPAGYTTFVQGATADSQCLLDCAAGSYLSVATNSCLPCEQGFYRDKSSPTQIACVKCPEDFITPSTSSDEASDCNIRNCTAPGQYRNSQSNDCEVCPVGTYNSQWWQDACTSCPSGFTTRLLGRATEAECLRDCPSGQQLNEANDVCTDCPLGFFRDATATWTCQSCPQDLTTAATRSTSASDCSVSSCSPGRFYNSSRSGCQNCPSNTYQSSSGQSDCLTCPKNQVTLTDGAASLDSCLGICEANLDNCSSYATCSNTNDGGFSCTCNNNYAGSGDICTHVCDLSEPYCQNGATCSKSSNSVCICTDFYEGSLCTIRRAAEQASDNKNEIIIGSSIGGLAFLLFFLLFIICLVKRMIRKRKWAEAYSGDKGSMANSSTYLGDTLDDSQLSRSHSPRFFMRANTRGYTDAIKGGLINGNGLRALDYSHDASSFNFDPSVYTPRTKGQAEYQQAYYMYDNSRIV